jgi:hypothetical protein
MKTFLTFDFSLKQCAEELQRFKALLDSQQNLREKEDILPLFNECKHLSAFLGSYSPYVGNFDRLAFEYELFGDFACDLVVGDSTTNRYCFIEFENANERSIFDKKKNKYAPEWGARFDHGFSQIIDWFWKLDDVKSTVDWKDRFGDKATVSYYAILVVGRDTSLGYRETHRKQWRLDKVKIDSREILCLTFDQLYKDLNQRIQNYIYLANNWKTIPLA